MTEKEAPRVIYCIVSAQGTPWEAFKTLEDAERAVRKTDYRIIAYERVERPIDKASEVKQLCRLYQV